MASTSDSGDQAKEPSPGTSRPPSRPEEARPPGRVTPTGGDPSPPIPGEQRPATSPPAASGAQPKPPVPFTQQLGRVSLVVLAVLFVVFALANAQPVDFSWVFGESEVLRDSRGRPVGGGVPLIVLLIASFVLGALVTALAIFQVRRARSHRDAADRAERRRRRSRTDPPA